MHTRNPIVISTVSSALVAILLLSLRCAELQPTEPAELQPTEDPTELQPTEDPTELQPTEDPTEPAEPTEPATPGRIACCTPGGVCYPLEIGDWTICRGTGGTVRLCTSCLNGIVRVCESGMSNTDTSVTCY